MARRSRLSTSIPVLSIFSAVALALAVTWAAQAPETGPAPQSAPAAPATAPEAAPPAKEKERVKPSDPPQMVLFFTDQVVGYIQPCG